MSNSSWKRFAALCLTLLLLSESPPSLSYQTRCRTGARSPTLKVTVPVNRRQAFIDFLRSGNLALGARYVGGAESDKSLSIDFLDTPDGTHEARIDISVENKKESPIFDFYIQTCNTDRSWKPYWDATRNRVETFGEATMVEPPTE